MLQELWTSLRTHRVRPPEPAHLTIKLADNDETEALLVADALPSYEGEAISGFACILVYRDSKGDESERRITCHRVERAGPQTYIVAFCHEREARRQFRVDRIVNLVDLHTGEVIDDPAEFIGRFRTDRVQAAALGWGLNPRRRADLIAGLNVLMFMGCCDREWHPLEREMLESFVSSFWLRAELSGEPPMEEILAHAERLSPDAETFFVALTRCHDCRILSGVIRRHIRQMIDADGYLRDEEFYWGSAVDDYLSSLAQ